jgi:RNA polymerase sigma-70 factor, ECF subfamily
MAFGPELVIVVDLRAGLIPPIREAVRFEYPDVQESFGRSVAEIASGVAGLTAAFDGRPDFDEYKSRTSFFVVATGASAETLGYRSMTGPRLSSDLDALLRRVARRDADAFAALYDRTKARVYGLVARVLRDSGYSEETTQEVYLEVWRSADTYDSAKGSALSWLMTMAHRRAVDRVRAEQAASQRESRYGAATVDPSSDVVADSAIAGDERRRVAECLDGLTDVQRQCIEMAYYGGLTYAEVSQRLSANLATIKSRMRDALRGLRNCLGVP